MESAGEGFFTNNNIVHIDVGIIMERIHCRHYSWGKRFVWFDL